MMGGQGRSERFIVRHISTASSISAGGAKSICQFVSRRTLRCSGLTCAAVCLSVPIVVSHAAVFLLIDAIRCCTSCAACVSALVSIRDKVIREFSS